MATESPADFLSPPDLFDRRSLPNTDSPSIPQPSPTFWTCVRARPRWEKKLAHWLKGQRIPHFLPIYLKYTVSHRKRRTTALPLFPGYVFIADDVTKGDLSKSGSVVRILKPASDPEARILDQQLHAIWQAVQSGQPIAPLTALAPGQRIEIIEGAMKGMEGTYVRDGRAGSLILSVDMLSSIVKVELPPDCRFLVLD